MKTSVTLKQLRTNPHEYIRLLNSGYEVVITEHRRELASSRTPRSKKPKPGSGSELIQYLKSRPPVKTPFPKEEDTVALMKRTRLEYLERKFGYKK